MSSDVALAPAGGVVERAETWQARAPRVWPAVVLVGMYWALAFTLASLELTTFVRFISRMGVCALLIILFTVWWALNRRVSGTDRLLGLAVTFLGGVLAAPFCDLESIGVLGLVMAGLPLAFTVWTVWLVVARRLSARAWRLGLAAAVLAAWGVFPLIRMNGLSGDQRVEIHWRWTPTAEALYLAEQAPANVPARSSAALRLQPGDWPGFRGPDRDSVVRGVTIATDWKAGTPRQAWRRRVGPGWSSVAVVGDRLFTQEQRGPAEAVVCLDAATGKEVWSHRDPVRFQEAVAGAGPRATPTFADGRVFALGATGILNCLDAATGERKWSHDIAADAGAKVPLWGFCNSPLIVKGMVIVYAGGESGKQILAYRAESGDLAWTAPAGSLSYTSPQPASLGGEEQVLALSDLGLTAVDPASGAVLWEHAAAVPGAPRSIQPHVVGPNQVLISSETDLGTARIDLRRDGGKWVAQERWASRALKPSFNDFVVHRGHAYGFDGAVFACIDLETGERRWKQGRYGHGQALLLADQELVLVISETGEAVLVAANPERHEERGKFPALRGKTWNHPVIAHGRLYVRNGEEMACYELGSPK
jgi:outer membrane protein assembly factor BamB